MNGNRWFRRSCRFWQGAQGLIPTALVTLATTSPSPLAGSPGVLGASSSRACIWARVLGSIPQSYMEAVRISNIASRTMEASMCRASAMSEA